MISAVGIHVVFGCVSGALFAFLTRRHFEQLLERSWRWAWYVVSLVLRLLLLVCGAYSADLLTGIPISYEFSVACVVGHLSVTAWLSRG